MDFLANTTADWFANNKTAFARSWLRNATPAGTVATRCHQSGTPRVFFFCVYPWTEVAFHKVRRSTSGPSIYFCVLKFFSGIHVMVLGVVLSIVMAATMSVIYGPQVIPM